MVFVPLGETLHALGVEHAELFEAVLHHFPPPCVEALFPRQPGHLRLQREVAVVLRVGRPDATVRVEREDIGQTGGVIPAGAGQPDG